MEKVVNTEITNADNLNAIKTLDVNFNKRIDGVKEELTQTIDTKIKNSEKKLSKQIKDSKNEVLEVIDEVVETFNYKNDSNSSNNNQVEQSMKKNKKKNKVKSKIIYLKQ